MLASILGGTGILQSSNKKVKTMTTYYVGHYYYIQFGEGTLFI